MTIKELIEALSKLDGNLDVVDALSQPVIGVEEYCDCISLVVDESEGV